MAREQREFSFISAKCNFNTRTLLMRKCHVLGSPGAMTGSSVHPHVSASLVSIPLRCLILLIRAISLWAVVYFTHQMPDEIFRHRELGPITTNS